MCITKGVMYFDVFQSPSSVITKDVQSSRQIVVNLGEYPIRIVCPECHEEMETKISDKIGVFTLALVLLLFFSFLWP